MHIGYFDVGLEYNSLIPRPLLYVILRVLYLAKRTTVMSKVQEVNGVILQHGHYCLPTLLVHIHDFCLQQSEDIWHTKWTQRHTQCYQTSCSHNVTKHLVYTMSQNTLFQGHQKAIRGGVAKVCVCPAAQQPNLSS